MDEPSEELPDVPPMDEPPDELPGGLPIDEPPDELPEVPAGGGLDVAPPGAVDVPPEVPPGVAPGGGVVALGGVPAGSLGGVLGADLLVGELVPP